MHSICRYVCIFAHIDADIRSYLAAQVNPFDGTRYNMEHVYDANLYV